MTTFPTSTQVDFVIVGAGAAGGVVAKELSTAGFQVVVLEQGPYLHERDFHHDELHFRHLGQAVSRAGSSHEQSQHAAKHVPPYGRGCRQTAARGRYGRCVGGGTVHFTANYWRFHEIDFIERSRWGAIEGTGFADWPIAYADLEPYYTNAEWDLGVSGLAGASPFDPPRSKPYPLPPMPVKSSGALFDRAASKLGWHSYPAPLAIRSQPYQGRTACKHCGFCEFFGCEFGAKSSTLASVIPMAEKTGRCEIRPNSYVRKISTDKRGRVDGVIYFDSARREQFQKAKAVVVCANGAETPRLLLMSESNRFPNGLANSSGLVGKYLMLEAVAGALGTFEFPLNEYKSVQVTRVLHDFYDSDPKRGFYGGGGLDARFDYYPIGYALFAMPPDAPRWGAGFKRAVGANFNRTLNVYAHTTALPLESNSISLDPSMKDAWGMPALRVTYKSHPDDLKNMTFFRDRALDLLEAAGATKKWGLPVEDTTASVHLMGTCRMGNDPKSSVADKYHRAHDVPNLFIVDGSSFVTSGRNQPTCTIQALAYRASDHIRLMAKNGSISVPL